MGLRLPPKAIIRCDPATAAAVHSTLTSVIAGHAMATTTYQFYEELDAWLGPWGTRGYPIAYGKFYNIAFSNNERLLANPKAKEWVWKTTILLQEGLRDYVVDRVRKCSIGNLTEAELRDAAFGTHPRAYDEAGLAMVMLVAPELIPVVLAIPYREFSPSSDNARRTITQVFDTIGRVSPQLVGNTLAVFAGPGHTGILRRAAQQDTREFINDMSLGRELANIRRAIDGGELDYLPALQLVIDRLQARQFPDQGFAKAARDIIALAESRKAVVLQRQEQLLLQSPEVRERVRELYPELAR